MVVKEVKNDPNMRNNLISTRYLGSEGCITTFTEKNMEGH